MLTITDLTCRIAGRPLIEGASLALPAGHKAGLIGRNGTGKTTLLKLIAGDLHADSGEIRLPNGTRVGRIAQEAPSGPQSLLETVLAADTERQSLLEEAEHATDGHRIADIHARLHELEAHSAPARAGAILHGLGFDVEAQQRPCSDFSGGWRMRVALAALLFQAPDLLLLDEPTNHLDLEATLWLEDFLKRYPHTILLVSHDRDLLNRAVNKIIHLHDRKLTSYTGGYDDFEHARSERLALQAAAKAKQDVQRKHMQAFIDRFRYKASKARQAQSRLKALAKMEPIAAVVEERGIEFQFPEPEELAPPLIVMDDVAVGYEAGKPVLSKVNLRLDPDERIALLGANGNGKSTMAKLLAGRLEPMNGELRRSRKLKVGYFAQHQTDELDLDATPLLSMERVAPKLTAEKCRAHLAQFGLDVMRANTKVGSLSGGEKARLLLALMSHGAPNILLLDEPSNHLDIDSRQALVQAINEFAGAVVLISHDPHLIELTVDRFWLVKDGRCQQFDGDLADYRDLVLTEDRSGADRGSRYRDRDPEERKSNRRAAEERKAERRNVAPASQPTDLRRQLDQSALAVDKLSQALALIERKLADPALYNETVETIGEWQRKHADVARRLADAEEAWLKAQETFDRANA
ncbi:MAG TPA: ABC-F family ATP-binding cassette domain-containing protein [Dongiaceae bacterium]|jgi:ATP-binding cassette subfamily F protein 3|nr:ABC-F family ATP-binding cassette domain-containing protein [Dongiaceae bacterium]